MQHLITYTEFGGMTCLHSDCVKDRGLAAKNSLAWEAMPVKPMKPSGSPLNQSVGYANSKMPRRRPRRGKRLSAVPRQPNAEETAL
jgi:hypothetical protein